MKKIFDSLFAKKDGEGGNGSPSASPVLSSSNNATNSNYNEANAYMTWIDTPVDGENILKLVFIGGSQVGKTSIIRRYLQNCFTTNYHPTIGTDLSTAKWHCFYHKNGNCNDSSPSNCASEGACSGNYRLQFIDVAHAEVKGRLHRNIFNGAAGVVMVFDACNVKSVTAVDEWRLAFETATKPTTTTPITNTSSTTPERTIPMMLMANKSDTGTQVIKSADLDSYCERGGYCMWRLTSARSGSSVNEAVSQFVEAILDIRRKEAEARLALRASRLASSGRTISQASTPSSSPHSSYTSAPNTPSLGRNSAVASTPAIDINGTPHHAPPTTPNIRSTATSSNTTLLGAGAVAPPIAASATTPAATTPAFSSTHAPASAPAPAGGVSSPVPADYGRLLELQSQAEDFYSTVKRDLDTLFNCVEPLRKPDLQVLEFQRFDEYQRYMSHVRKAMEYHTDRSGKRPLSKEQLHLRLSEGMKKWSTLVLNLHTEVSLSFPDQPEPASLATYYGIRGGGGSNSSSRTMTPYIRTPSSNSIPNSQTMSRNSSGANSSHDFRALAMAMSLEHEAFPPGVEHLSLSSEASVDDVTPYMSSSTSPGSALSYTPRTTESAPRSGLESPGDPATQTTRAQFNSNTVTPSRPVKGKRLGFGFKNAGRNTTSASTSVRTSQTPNTSYILDNDNIASPPSLSPSPSLSSFPAETPPESVTLPASLPSVPSLPSSYNISASFPDIKICDDVIT
eukprot:TRINITY_DN978_c0_g1_i1.p1 TRINITY_DN978_c0_g1~~TRINITY_DN978_c0_g1_i1.p1  ORF type:complete len:736 (-),score=185.58 TRINITY_DN978_c0_g1_i1:283-2490(-)